MQTFYALVDARPGHESEVASALRKVSGIAGVAACKEKSHDFLVKFAAPSFQVVDDFLQTHVRRLPNVKGVEVVVDWDDHGAAVLEARERLG